MFDKKRYMKERYIKNIEKERLRQKQYYEDNPEYDKQYYEKNKEKILKRKKQYGFTHRKERNEYCRNKYNTDLRYNLDYRMRRAISHSIRGNKANQNWETLVGYSIKDLIERLKKTIPKGYCWNDYLEGRLHIDHKIPKSVFNFTRPEHIDFKKCWALTNLQLLPAKENIIKRDKLYKPFQPALKI